MVAQAKVDFDTSIRKLEALTIAVRVSDHRLAAEGNFMSSSDDRSVSRLTSLRFPKLNASALKMSTHLLVKRMVDIVVSLAALIVLAPLCAIVALLIKATDHGPVLFWQTRVGRDGREFSFPKFRSMVPNAEQYLQALLHLNDHKSGVTFKIKKDPRITWIGGILRRTSIDELPQLWCVLTGQMTLVGPRPAVPREVALYSETERQRLSATPGLTGIWQVSGRGDLPFPEQVAMDVEYIEKQSFWLDMKLLVLTVPAVLSGKGAY